MPVCHWLFAEPRLCWLSDLACMLHDTTSSDRQPNFTTTRTLLLFANMEGERDCGSHLSATERLSIEVFCGLACPMDTTLLKPLPHGSHATRRHECSFNVVRTNVHVAVRLLYLAFQGHV